MTLMDGTLLGFEVTPPRLLLGFFSFLVGYIFLQISRYATSPLARIKYVSGLPIVRQLPAVILSKDIKQLYLSWIELTKDDGIYRVLDVTGSVAVGVFKPEYVRQVLVTKSKIYRRPQFYNKLLSSGDGGVFTSFGTSHALERKLMNPMFSHSSVSSYIKKSQKYCMDLVMVWSKECDASSSGIWATNVGEDITYLTLDVIGEVAFGYKFNSITNRKSGFIKDFMLLLGGGMSRSTVIAKVLIPFLDYLPFTFVRDLNRAVSIKNEVIDKIIKQKRELLETPGNVEEDGTDLLTVLMKALDDDDAVCKMTNDDLKNNAWIFLFGGHETTSTCLTWTLYHLARNLDVQEKARKEVVYTLKYREKELLPEDVDKLEYVTAVIKESLRLTPPAGSIRRETIENDQFDQFFIPKGTVVTIPVAGIHNYELYWPEPSKFIPERFLESDPTWSPGISGQTYLPFANGPMNCIGSKFAMMEMKVALAHLLYFFRFDISPDHPEVGNVERVTLRPVPPPTLLLSRISKDEINQIMENS